MNARKDVVACFVLYEQDRIVLQCSFQVEEDLSTNSFRASDGAEFVFNHSYDKSTCYVEVTGTSNDAASKSLHLEFPINRTKIKWRQIDFADTFVLYYRSQFEPGPY